MKISATPLPGLQGRQQANRPSSNPSGSADQFSPASSSNHSQPGLSSTLARKVGPYSSVIAGTAIGAGVTALAASAFGVGLTLAAPAILTAGVAGVAIGLYRSRNDRGNFPLMGQAISGMFHGAAGVAGGVVGKATMLGLAAGGTGAAVVAGVAATAVVGAAVLYGVVKAAEAFHWR